MEDMIMANTNMAAPIELTDAALDAVAAGANNNNRKRWPVALL